MSRTEWPKLCSIADAARLFATVGVRIDRSNLSRFIQSRKIKLVQQGKQRLVDPDALFERYSTDYGRQVMAGQTGSAASLMAASPSPGSQPGDGVGGSALSPAPPADAPSYEPAYDPKRHLAELNAQTLQLDVADRLARTLSADEVATTLAEAIAEMRSAFTRKARDDAARALTELGLPGHMLGVLTAVLKRHAANGQEAFAASVSQLLTGSSGAAARERLDALVAYAIDLRDEDTADENPALEPALAR